MYINTRPVVASSLASSRRREGKSVGLQSHTTLHSRRCDDYGIEDSTAPILNFFVGHPTKIGLAFGYGGTFDTSSLRLA
jgi:hypothetical protein